MDHRIQYSFNHFENYLLRLFQLGIFENAGSLPYHKTHKVSVRENEGDLLNRLENLQGYAIYHQQTNALLAHSDRAIIRVHTYLRPPVVACSIEIWAIDSSSGQSAWRDVTRLLGPTSADSARDVHIHWLYKSEHGLDTALFRERIDETICPSAYPWLPTDVDSFVEKFRSAEEPILILYGPPGAGKTKLIRHILRSLQGRDGKIADVLYTTDEQILQSDEFFIRFLTTGNDALVIEDADHVLTPRSNGNQHLHRILAASDGLLQSRGRKLIFSTNLPSKLDIDDALARPGRCFACIGSRKLTQKEAVDVLKELLDDTQSIDFSHKLLRAGSSDKGVSLAEIYAAVRQAKAELKIDTAASISHVYQRVSQP